MAGSDHVKYLSERPAGLAWAEKKSEWLSATDAGHAKEIAVPPVAEASEPPHVSPETSHERPETE